MPSPSLRHEALVQLVHQHPQLAADLVRLARAYGIPDDVKAEHGSEDLSDVTPPSADPDAEPLKLTADAVVTLSDPATGDPIVVAIIEPQGEADDDKDFSWPCYLVNARLAARCRAAVLVVLCWDQAEADRCRRAIATGHFGFVLIPYVVDRRDTPDLDTAHPNLVLCFTVLGAVDIATSEGAARVASAIAASGADKIKHRILIRIMLGLAARTSDAALRLIREQLMAFTYERDFIDDLIDEASERAAREAAEKATREATERVARETTKVNLLKVISARGLTLTEQQAALVNGSTDPAEVDAWFDRAPTANSADDIFKK